MLGALAQGADYWHAETYYWNARSYYQNAACAKARRVFSDVSLGMLMNGRDGVNIFNCDSRRLPVNCHE